MLVLLQTRHVLHRPYCLLELLTAIDFKVPIVGGDTATAPAPSTPTASPPPHPPGKACGGEGDGGGGPFCRSPP